MTTVHVLPCGTSILRNLAAGVRGSPLTSVQLGAMGNWADNELLRDQPASQWSQSFDRDIGPHLPGLRAVQDPVRLSAETASLTRYAGRAGGLGPTDLVVLLASDTPEGVLAALLVAAALRRGIRVHAAPPPNVAGDGELLVGEDSGDQPVHVMRIPDLLPDSTVRFTAAMSALARGMLWAGQGRRRPNGAGLVVHLSGGYKATLPYLVVMCEYLKALQRPVQAFCLHEGDPGSAVLPDLVEIFLRSVDLDADLAVLAQAAAGHMPTDPRLYDFAYEEVGGRAQLTGIGSVLSAFQFCRGGGP